MRKASMILGIVGGSLAIVSALFFLVIGIMTMTVFPNFVDSLVDEQAIAELAEEYDTEMVSYDSAMKSSARKSIEDGILTLIAGILGIVGGVQVKKNNVTGSVLMFMGCLFCALSWFRFIAFTILLLGGIFGLVKDNSIPSDDLPDYNEMMGRNASLSENNE